MKKQDDDAAQSRKPYEKPRLRSFPLAADEVLATGCKTTTPGTGFQGVNCAAGGCFRIGS
ncbi:MAG: hypothetical protein V3T15_02645 [Pseudomonadales bacterium]